MSNPVLIMVKQTKPDTYARPFLKWAGGKTQLLSEFEKRLPQELKNKTITKYAEPFIGGGAVFFWLNKTFSFNHAYICDINEELVLTYKTIRRSTKDLIAVLGNLESEYLSRNDEEKEQFYYAIRDSFNQKLPDMDFNEYSADWVERAARIIFLNRTCFNGLFRVNRKGEFNVPFGKYKKPDILNEENLNEVAALLRTTEIFTGDFTSVGEFVDDQTFVYFDPPYRPLNDTSFFTSYSKNGFSEKDQMRLVEFFRKLDEKGAKCMLSNSDPRNENPDDTFFDDLFADYYIERVPARRMINSSGAGRGEINELIITNYPMDKTG
ncbi:MAG: DNA adenine methylase [Methanoregula sp.]|nr:DNA adenine methylase [Methanoregula sp.]